MADSNSATKTRPIITPSSLSRRTAATTRSFSSLPPPRTAQAPTLSVIAASPDPSPVTPTVRRVHARSDPETPSRDFRLEVPQVKKSHSSGSGKRKAEEVEIESSGTTSKEQQRATFAPEPRTHRTSAASTAPSSYRRKRARLSLPSEPPSRPSSRSAMGTVSESPNAKTTGSCSSKRSFRASVNDSPRRNSKHATGHARSNSFTRSVSRQSNAQASTSSYIPGSVGSGGGPYNLHAPSRPSLSQASIPISALISPHAPSVTSGMSRGKYHMRDPRKPAPVQRTPWSLAFPLEVQRGESRWELKSWVERGGSPLHAWFFFLGFVAFPMWWVASFVGVPRTRRLAAGNAGNAEKGVVLDDPQVEYDARSWRNRCRVMAVISIVTYIPFIVCVIIFA
ncbi:hypothetical protein AGABI2DRAFT_119302 [Agaricus bisporus var. bisporus H97]|nr:hypothetical protein AGABI2DRAFT_119302 [Agaricus bisporus var. bisporus H97]EKV45625.1 hypothetical protein AGABI2DRAFT_119302 [Agaricus bisporus var. bisporus H97]